MITYSQLLPSRLHSTTFKAMHGTNPTSEANHASAVGDQVDAHVLAIVLPTEYGALYHHRDGHGPPRIATRTSWQQTPDGHFELAHIDLGCGHEGQQFVSSTVIGEKVIQRQPLLQQLCWRKS